MPDNEGGMYLLAIPEPRDNVTDISKTLRSAGHDQIFVFC
jgi:hypothetical protein